MKKLVPAACISERPVFRGVEMEQTWRVEGYRRNLPHLRVEGATYFVTFRLADSIPREVVLRWREEDEQWLRAHGIAPTPVESKPGLRDAAWSAIPPSERSEFERSQHRRFFLELDRCHGSCALERAHEIVAGALEFFHGQRVWLGDYVVMPNHVHVLVQPFRGMALEEWLYSVKRFASRRIRKEVREGQAGHLWQSESFDRVVRDTAELARTRRYILNNPAKLRPGSFALKQVSWLDEFAPT